VYPKYGNLVPRDVATRAIFKVVFEEKLGIDGQPMVYLDLTHIDAKTLDRKLEGILEIYEKFVGDDPRVTPMKIFPACTTPWADCGSITNSRRTSRYLRRRRGGISVHGANRLGANSLMSCIYGGFISGPNAVEYAKSLQAAPGNAHFDAERKRQQDINSGLMKADGKENPFLLWRELGALMTENCTVIRYSKKCEEADSKVVDLLHRFQKINLSDRSQWANTTIAFARQLQNMLQLSRVIAQGAAMRDESRGSHYKPDFPERDDKNWMKTTKAVFAPMRMSQSLSSKRWMRV